MRANPSFSSRLWYGMPGYAMSKDSAVLCFFRKDTLVTFGITEAAKLDSLVQDDSYAASSWFITNLNQSSEDLISRTVKSISE